MPKRKIFIDKKNSVAFRLLHRSQRDPLIATDGGDRVLAPIEGVEKLKITDGNSSASSKSLSLHERKLEQAKLGINFDDDYDYLQHLKDVNEVYSLVPIKERYRILPDGKAVDSGKDITPTTSKLELPARLFESQGVELKVGLLNQAAPRPGPHPELDPDIVAALDEDFDFADPNNQLEDDFILKANAVDSVAELRQIEEKSVSDSDSTGPDIDSDEDSEGDSEGFSEEETKSRFTNYSITSSVMRRSKGLQQVDAMFEKLYEQYDDQELGDLDTVEEEIQGFFDPDGDRMMQLIEEYEEDKDMKQKISDIVLNQKHPDTQAGYVGADEDIEKIFVHDQPKEQWDCESVISTYSNLYNRPTVIAAPKNKRRKIQLDPKTGIPREILNSSSLAPVLKQLDDSQDTRGVRTNKSTASTVRSKLETPEQKRLRKQTIKMERKERRLEKKANQVAFKSEEKRRNLIQLNLQKNLLGVKLL